MNYARKAMLERLEKNPHFVMTGAQEAELQGYRDEESAMVIQTHEITRDDLETGVPTKKGKKKKKQTGE